MATKISLDASAVEFLINKDPEFEVELQKAVIANITKRYLKGNGAFSDETVKEAMLEVKKLFDEKMAEFKTQALEMVKREIQEYDLEDKSPLTERMRKRAEHLARERVRDGFYEVFKEETMEKIASAEADRLVASMKITEEGLQALIKERLKSQMIELMCDELDALGVEHSHARISK